MDSRHSKAETLRALHHAPNILLLPNAWDVASARIFETAGFPALATTSAGIAFSLGYPDGERITRQEMLSVVARIAGSIAIPVTADVEAAYGESAEAAELTAAGVIEAGAVGLNLEDGTNDPAHPLVDLSLQLEKIHAVRGTGEAMDVPLVLNARTDVYLAAVGPVEKRYDEALRRCIAFRDAGADCIFIPGVKDAATISRFVRDLQCPINILAGPGTPPIPELQKLGVARVTIGSGAMRACMGLVQSIADELRASGTYHTMESAIPHADLNRLMQGK
ncbi:MAG TPA: isocitrate lyase/phosphoenolpyruvate mutase family protein [Terriglobales bacterium]|nr:isocitrate lyase/phosphoenolpyruvate mutase family protein [Terriglobales bacterium]